MIQHTPGNWEIQEVYTRDMVRVVVRRGHLVHEIADVNTPDGDPEGHANALLIAAAPDLLEAAKEALGYLKQIADHDRLEMQLRAGIKKAEGKRI